MKPSLLRLIKGLWDCLMAIGSKVLPTSQSKHYIIMTKITEEQKELLVAFMEDNPKLVSAKFTATFTYKVINEMWDKYSEILNACRGPNKKGSEWRKTWHDLRRGAKDKMAKINVHRRCTGGGEPLGETITPLQERIIAIIGSAAVEGHQHPETVLIEVTPDCEEELTAAPAPVPVILAWRAFASATEQPWNSPTGLSSDEEDLASKAAAPQRPNSKKKCRVRAAEARRSVTKKASQRFEALHTKRLALRKAELRLLEKRDAREEELLELRRREVAANKKKASAIKKLADYVVGHWLF